MTYTTAAQAIDVLTPLGRGQAQLLTGPPDSGKTLAAVDAILGQVCESALL
jgi:F0F1-type ATP synthase alpha subunit